ncbi:MAG: type II toxin-antitoxin system RelE/ParE family toxin [Actinomycetota bacterium]|nr:type II toxin-antitoxin system RelE/ParE family toxin [Actinomycetota bacterium]
MYGRVTQTIDGLARTPRPRGSRKLQDREGRRVRVGDYSVIYEVDDERQLVAVLQVGHRRDIYR